MATLVAIDIETGVCTAYERDGRMDTVRSVGRTHFPNWGPFAPVEVESIERFRLNPYYAEGNP